MDGGSMRKGVLGKEYQDGEDIVRQGDTGDSMYEILKGKVEVTQERENRQVRLAVLKKGDFFGEMAIFEHEVRSATVRAMGKVQVLTIDKKTLLRRISEDPSLAFRMVEHLSHRIRELDAELVGLKRQNFTNSVF
jgi:CRP-like cAMP-binding protein